MPVKAQIDSVLLSAIKNCDLHEVQQRLINKIDINAVDHNGANALMWAVYQCDLPLFKYLVQHGAKVADSAVIFVNDNTMYCSSLQGIAARHGKLELLQYLADTLHLSLDEKEYNPYSRKKDCLTVLTCAAKYGHVDLVKYLLRKGVQIDVVDDDESSTPLISAAESEQWVIFDLLMKTAANEKRFGKQRDYFMAAAAQLKQPYPNQRIKELKIQQFILALRKVYFGDSHPGYPTGLLRMAVVHDMVGEYEKAAPFYIKAIEIFKKISREDHPQYAGCLNNLAELYVNMGKYENAVPLLEEAQTLTKRIYGEDHFVYAASLRILALAYNHMGRYDKALPLCQTALTIIKKTRGEDHYIYANILNNLAYLYIDIGQYKEGLLLYQQSSTIYKRIGGEISESYGGSLIDLAYTYSRLGQYKEALPLFQQALIITNNTLGEKHPWHALILDGIAIIYRRLGDFNKALSFYEQALTIRKMALGEEHPHYAISLKNLAALYMESAEYNKALPLYQQAVDITKKVLKEEHAQYAIILNELAFVYTRNEQYDTARHIYGQALNIMKKALGEDHPVYAHNLADLASLYVNVRMYDTALRLYQQVLGIRKKALGEAYPDNVPVLNSVGLLYRMMGNAAASSPIFIEACNLQLNHLGHTYSSLSEQEKMIFLNKETYQFSYLPSILYLHATGQPSLVTQAYQNELALKGMVLEDQQQVLNNIRKSRDSIAFNLYKDWRFNKAFIGKQFLLPIKQRITYLDSMMNVTNRLEQQLSRHSASFQSLKRNQSIRVNEIAQRLTEGQAAIEFIRFPLFNQKHTDSTMYAAMVLLPQDSIAKFVPLFEEKLLQRLLQPSGGSSTAYETIKKLYATSSKEAGLNDSLYNLIWKPLEKYLTGIHTISYAPAGLLHRISFQALRSDPTHFLIDKYQLNQMLSTRSVALPAQMVKRPSTVSVWGAIRYSVDNSRAGLNSTRGENEIVTDTTSSSFNFYNWDTRDSRGKEWIPLPGTKQEMDSIKKIFCRAGIPISAKTDTSASEEAFKALDGKSPQVLHLATHGFFLPVPETKPTDNQSLGGSNPFTLQQNPMFRSGLVLAGGNHAWKGEAALPGKEDGILTAYEIAQMDLSNTDLVVLSACGTALGDLQGNEGAIGLQRAFKLAGVKQMIISLWPVPDVETAELMTLFYRNWLKGNSTREALKKAQLKMKEKYPSPYYWAAFVVEE